MELQKIATWEMECLISELVQGRDATNELKRQINPSTTTSGEEGCGILLQQIICHCDNALAMLSSMNSNVLASVSPGQFSVSHELSNPLNSILGSPLSEVSDPDPKDQDRENVCKKRKTIPRWSKQVRVCSWTGFEGQLDDGYKWRKYGQKEILSATHPRAYYRCTHRKTQGCLATKQVQRTDQDPSVLEVVYRGNHSCVQQRQNQQTVGVQGNDQENQIPPLISNEPSGLKVELKNGETQLSWNDLGIDYNLQSLGSEFNEMISDPTSQTSFQFGDLDFLIGGQVDFDSCLDDAPGFLY